MSKHGPGIETTSPKTTAATPAAGISSGSSTGKPRWPFILIIVGFAILITLFALIWKGVIPVGSESSPPPGAEEDRICDRFMQLHNQRDPAALELLGRAPVVPAVPITEAEADPLATEFFLRDMHYRIERYRVKTAAKGDRVYVFRTNGNVVSPPLRTWKADGTEMRPPPQRIMINPDLHVEVRGGKIFAVRSTVQRD